MSDELTTAPVFSGRYVTYGGRTMLRAAGGETDAPEVQETPPENAAPEGTPAPDPEYTPERARGLHAELTKAQQELASVRETMQLVERAKSGDLEALSGLSGGLQFQSPDEEEPDPEDEPYGEAEIADPVAREWIQNQEVEKNVRAFNAHLDKLAGDPTLLDEVTRQGLLQASVAGGFNEQATEKAFKAWKEAYDAREKQIIETYRKSKKAPHVSQAGTGATETPFRDDMSLDERIAAAQELARLRSEQE